MRERIREETGKGVQVFEIEYLLSIKVKRKVPSEFVISKRESRERGNVLLAFGGILRSVTLRRNRSASGTLIFVAASERQVPSVRLTCHSEGIGGRMLTIPHHPHRIRHRRTHHCQSPLLQPHLARISKPFQ